MKWVLLLSWVGLLAGCGTFSGSDFVRSSTQTFAPTPAETEILVFFKGTTPDREFVVIGMAYAHKSAPTKFQSADPAAVVELLKEEARRRGGHAIVEVTVTPVEDAPRTRKMGEAKVVRFRDPEA